MMERRTVPAAHLAAQVYFELMLRLQVRIGLENVKLFRMEELRDCNGHGA
jgi:hypothetical protein